MYNSMIFPATVDEFMEEYKVVDSEHVYSNGMEMVPIFRMKQWFEHEANHNAEPGKMVADTISRRAAIDATSEIVFVEYEDDDTRKEESIILQTKAAIRDRIKALPPVQPERNKGHWIEIASRNHTYKCSVCGRLLVNITDGKNNVAKNYPYCHCGADMRGNEHGTD